MPHVSTDGPARPSYVNVAFQGEETELEEGGGGSCCCFWWLLGSFVTCAHFLFLFSLLIQRMSMSLEQTESSLFAFVVKYACREVIF